MLWHLSQPEKDHSSLGPCLHCLWQATGPSWQLWVEIPALWSMLTWWHWAGMQESVTTSGRSGASPTVVGLRTVCSHSLCLNKLWKGKKTELVWLNCLTCSLEEERGSELLCQIVLRQRDRPSNFDRPSWLFPGSLQQKDSLHGCLEVRCALLHELHPLALLSLRISCKQIPSCKCRYLWPQVKKCFITSKDIWPCIHKGLIISHFRAIHAQAISEDKEWGSLAVWYRLDTLADKQPWRQKCIWRRLTPKLSLPGWWTGHSGRAGVLPFCTFVPCC